MATLEKPLQSEGLTPCLPVTILKRVLKLLTRVEIDFRGGGQSL